MIVGATVRDPKAASSMPLEATLSPVSVTWPRPGYGNKAFTGREWDSETGLYYYRAYDPKLGRFITEDPIGFEDDINLYAYVGNNPINFTDPYGEWRIPESVAKWVRPVVMTWKMLTGQPALRRAST